MDVSVSPAVSITAPHHDTVKTAAPIASSAPHAAASAVAVPPLSAAISASPSTLPSRIASREESLPANIRYAPSRAPHDASAPTPFDVSA